MEASDNVSSVHGAEIYTFFESKDVSSGPVEDDLTNGILVINFGASLDTTISKRIVYNILNWFFNVGGFSCIFLLFTYMAV